MPRLTSEQRLRAIGMLESGDTQRVVAQRLGCSQVTICNLATRYRDTNAAADRQRSGRPRVTTRAEDRHILLTHLRDRFRPATRTAAETPGLQNPRISASTVRRRLHSFDLQARRPYRGPVLQPIHRRNRLRWSQQHLRWTQREWRQVLFSDESRFCVDAPDGRERVWRRRGERFTDNCVRQRNRWGGPSVMVWAGISSRHRTPLVVVNETLTAQRYIDQILRPYLLPFLQDHPDVTIFQQDNARPHAARLTTAFLQTHNVEVMEWMPYSPDLSPIEHLWDELERRIARRNQRPNNRQMLIEALQEEWARIPQATIRRLIESMRNRCIACIAARGGHTRY